MKVFGVDPAPAKGLTVCCDEGIKPGSLAVKSGDAHEFIQSISTGKEVLVC